MHGACRVGNLDGIGCCETIGRYRRYFYTLRFIIRNSFDTHNIHESLAALYIEKIGFGRSFVKSSELPSECFPRIT